MTKGQIRWSEISGIFPFGVKMTLSKFALQDLKDLRALLGSKLYSDLREGLIGQPTITQLVQLTNSDRLKTALTVIRIKGNRNNRL